MAPRTQPTRRRIGGPAIDVVIGRRAHAPVGTGLQADRPSPFRASLAGAPRLHVFRCPPRSRQALVLPWLSLWSESGGSRACPPLPSRLRRQSALGCQGAQAPRRSTPPLPPTDTEQTGKRCRVQRSSLPLLVARCRSVDRSRE